MPYNFVAGSFHTGVTAEALQAKIDDFARGHFDPKFQVKGVARPPMILARLVRLMNALQLCANSFHTKKLCSRLSSSEVRF